MAEDGFCCQVKGMHSVMISPRANEKAGSTPKPSGDADLDHGKTNKPTAHEPAPRPARRINESKGAPPENGVKQWLEAESQLFGGVERETQMHPGASFFATEH
jgi:hypothetical protein